MDDALLAGFQSAFSVSGEVNDTRSPHPHYTLYKQKREGYGDQDTRRRKLLSDQKSRRNDLADYARRFAEGELWEEEMDDQEEGSEGYDEVDTESPTSATGEAMQTSRSGDKRKYRRRRRRQMYKNKLMLSEWMVDVPKDFEHHWIMLICPVGKRSLVIAAKGTTTAYSRVGQCLNNFPSNLPGGCRRTFHTSSDYCILDCIYHEVTRTYYVLDLMCWRGHPVYDSDAEFRFFWLKTKLNDEGEKLSMPSRINPFRFIPLDSYPCTKESISQILGSKWPLEVDGLLFFHKQGHYNHGRSPLAVWLKAHMVPDLLGLPVSQEFLACAPAISDVKMDATQGKEDGRSETKPTPAPQSQTQSEESMDDSSSITQ